MEKNYRKTKVFFWSGLIMLVLAGGVWAIGGGFGRIKEALANNDAGTSDAPGHYSETWTATEAFGLYRMAYTDLLMNNRDSGRLVDNFWVSQTGERVCGEEVLIGGKYFPTTASDQAYAGTSSSSCTYRTLATFSSDGGTTRKYGSGYMDSQSSYPNFVTKWEVNGHVH